MFQSVPTYINSWTQHFILKKFHFIPTDSDPYWCVPIYSDLIRFFFSPNFQSVLLNIIRGSPSYVPAETVRNWTPTSVIESWVLWPNRLVYKRFIYPLLVHVGTLLSNLDKAWLSIPCASKYLKNIPMILKQYKVMLHLILKQHNH